MCVRFERIFTGITLHRVYSRQTHKTNNAENCIIIYFIASLRWEVFANSFLFTEKSQMSSFDFKVQIVQELILGRISLFDSGKEFSLDSMWFTNQAITFAQYSIVENFKWMLRS